MKKARSSLVVIGALALITFILVAGVLTADPPHKQGQVISPVQDRLDNAFSAETPIDTIVLPDQVFENLIWKPHGNPEELSVLCQTI